MSNQNNKLDVKSILNITLRLFVVCTLIAAVVASVNALTKSRIEENEKKAIAETIRSVFNECSIEQIDVVNSDGSSVDAVYYISDNSGKQLGYSVICFPSGFGGEIKMMVAFDTEKNISSVNVMSHSETPGIGDKIMSYDYIWFREQFIGKNSEFSFGADGINKISGSSKSSNAVLKGINDAVKALNSIN